jgi:hypothetical protein
VKHRLERGETPEMPSISRNSSYSNLVSSQRRDRSRTPQVRPPSASSSRHKKRRDTALSRSDTVSTQHSSGESSDTARKTDSAPGASDIKVIRVRPALSTVVSSNSGANELMPSPFGSNDENMLPEKPSPVHRRRDFTYSSTSTQSFRNSTPYLRAPLSSSDVSSLNVLQDLVSPRDLLKSRFVSAPLVEAKIRLPPEDNEESRTLSQKPLRPHEQVRVPFDHEGLPVRDPRFRWSVDF